MNNEVIGREPIQIISIDFPSCANVHGVAPCMATQQGDDKCYNTFATCNDVANYRATPEGGIDTAPDVFKQEETILSASLDKTQDLFFAVDIRVPLSVTGTIFEIGGLGDGTYLGITGSNLVFRAGGGSTSLDPDTAKITVPKTLIEGRTVTLLGEIDISAAAVRLWEFDTCTLELTLLGENTAASPFISWAGGDNGAVGLTNSDFTASEDGGDWSGGIDELRLYQQTAAPDMDAVFKQTLYFGRKQQGKPLDDILIWPMVKEVSSVGSRINLASADQNLSPLGSRATVDIMMEDGLGSDIVVDPYLVDRSLNPLENSTFWFKLWARQKFGKLGATVTIYEGYTGQRLDQMQSRRYFMDKLELKGRAGARLYCRDVLTRSEIAKAQAPRASPGILNLAIDDTTALPTFQVTGMVLTDYPSSGTVRVNNELFTYSSITDNLNGTFNFVLTGRDTDGSERSEHSVDDSVQECLRYTSARVDDVLLDLLGNFADIEYQFMNVVGFESETTAFLAAYALETLITEPTSVKQLVGELAEQCSFYIWWDERDQIIDMQAIRGINVLPPSLNDSEHFLEDSVELIERPEQRVSQIWIYHNQFDPTEQLDDTQNYMNLYIDANLELEGQNQYRQRQIRQIFSRWLPTNAMAVQTASRIISRYQDVPIEITFELDAKDENFWVGDTFFLDHYLLVDQNGRRLTNRFFIILQARPDHFSGRISYLAQDITLTGGIKVIVGNSTPDYVGDGSDQFDGAWISDNAGLYGNGDQGARIQ